jgi:hypothetical protein
VLFLSPAVFASLAASYIAIKVALGGLMADRTERFPFPGPEGVVNGYAIRIRWPHALRRPQGKTTLSVSVLEALAKVLYPNSECDAATARRP